MCSVSQPQPALQCNPLAIALYNTVEENADFKSKLRKLSFNLCFIHTIVLKSTILSFSDEENTKRMLAETNNT